MRTEVIKRGELADFEQLILPVVYEELSDFSEDMGEIYLCLASFEEPQKAGSQCDPLKPDTAGGSDADASHEQLTGGRAVSALIMELEDTGDLNILSLYTFERYRRKGHASALLKKAVEAARELFSWDEGEITEEVILKTLYRLPENMEEIYEAFLIKNGFTDFVLLDVINEMKVWSAYRQLLFFRTREEA